MILFLRGLLKLHPVSIAKPFSDLVNTIIAKSQVPDTWKHGQTTPHHKKESVLDKKNFRPVTVLTCLCQGV